MRASTLLAAAVIAVAAFLPSSASAAAATGSVSGTVSAKPGKNGQGRIVATNLADGSVAAAQPISKTGAFKVALPAGAYGFEVIVVPAVGAGRVSTASFPVSLKAGQHRRKVVVKTKKPRSPKGGKSALGSRAYVQEKGQVTPGVTAFSVEAFTGATGDWGVLNDGLAAMLVTDFSGGTPCKTALIANSADRKELQKEIDLGKSEYFDQKTRVRRNWVIGDLTVSGEFAMAPDGASALVTARITDSRTGAAIDNVIRKLSRDTLWDDITKLGKQIAERVCRRPAGYELALAVQGGGNFLSHTATGTVDSTLTAPTAGTDADQQPSAWSGTATTAWQNLAATANPGIPCSFLPDGSSALNWKADLAVDGEQVRVAFGPTGNAESSFTAYCPTPNGTAVTPGFKGPALFGADQGKGVVPLTGGTIPISITWGEGGIGWTNIGQLTVTPIWARTNG